ncbi:MAG: F0F1 ATP synthase subunit alpha [Candidatus Wildermuthbacteria bacterium]|nr:F0F1 ATP synthase subunit alpha [Candidatus Wildermuthbacteria bacterium]
MDKSFIDVLKQQMEGITVETKGEEIGRVSSVADGIVQIEGLPNVKFSEMVLVGQWPLGTNEKAKSFPAMVLNLEEYTAGAVLFEGEAEVKEGDVVKRTGKVLSVPVGEQLLGRVVNSLGQPIDGRGPLSNKEMEMFPIERPAPSVMDREGVNTSMATGLKVIDAIIPIGRGQRELIIGDRQIGKTAIAQDTILNQLNEPAERRPICIYVAIGQKAAKVAQLVQELRARGAMDYTIVVSATAYDPAPLWYIAPYAGTSMGEYFRDKGKDVLIIYDDLSKHAQAWREIALLLRRPPGREAYPGDVFYLHSRLLERASKLSKEKGGGSLTALPIIETQAGDVSAYIPTNVISITDGQIYLELDLFARGQRPAVNIGLSVSRVGSAAQTKAMKKVAGQLKLELAKYQELVAFAQFAQDLDPATRQRITRGARLTELLKQSQGVVLPFEEQVAVIFAGTQGFADDIPLEKVKEFETKLLDYLRDNQSALLAKIRETRDFPEEVQQEARQAIEAFASNFK